MVLYKLYKLMEYDFKWVGTFKNRKDLFEYRDKNYPKECIWIKEDLVIDFSTTK